MAQTTPKPAQPQSATKDYLWITREFASDPPVQNTMVVCFDYVIWVLMGRPQNGLLGPKSGWSCLQGILNSKNYELFRNFSTLGGNQKQIDALIKVGDVITMGGYGHTLFVNLNERVNHMLQPSSGAYQGRLYLTPRGARTLELNGDWRKAWPGIFPDRPNIMTNWSMNMVSMLPRASNADVQIWRKKKPEPSLPIWVHPIAGG